MDEPLIVSVSGIRGIMGRSLTVEAAAAFAQALATHLGEGSIVIGRDGRPSGVALKHAVVSGILAAGRNAIDVGIVPTPTFGYAVARLKAVGGIQITASHNPAPWNGLKLFGRDGAVLPPEEGKKVQGVYESRAFRQAVWNEVGQASECPLALDWHRERVLQLVDVERIRERSFRVLLDANGGAGGPLGLKLLHYLGCDITALFCEADGNFAHTPEPIAANLVDVCPRVAENQCDLGCVLDPDSDRLALIDETGRYIGEELTLALAALQRLEEDKGPVVVNMSTSRLVEDIAREKNCRFVRSAVGEANVTALMRSERAVIGGEGNGGVIDPRVGFVRDPFIGISLVLELLARKGKKLSELVARLPAYTIVKDKYTLGADRLPALYGELEKRWPETKINRDDGLRLDWPDRWLHVRPSNTEPIVRVIAEAPSETAAQQLCRDVGSLIR